MEINTFIQAIQSGDDTQAEAAVSYLADLSDQQKAACLPYLADFLDSPDANQRWWAVCALGEIPGSEADALRLRALSDADLTVRQCAALTLRLYPSPQAVPQLVNILTTSDNSLVTDGLLLQLAGDALSAIGEPAVPALLETLGSAGYAARIQATRALAHIGDVRSIPALFKMLDEDSALLEYWASQGLEKMGVGMAFFLPQ